MSRKVDLRTHARVANWLGACRRLTNREHPQKRRAYRWTFAIVAMAVSGVIGGSFLRADVPQVATGSWMEMQSGPFGDALPGAASAVLPDGKVVVAGGQLADGSFTAAVVLYDPALGEWKSAGTLSEPRAGLSAAALPDGRVVFAGGRTAAGVAASVEVFDPQAGSSQLAGEMMLRRADAAAATLPDGRVLIAGGTDGASPLAAAELFDPVSGTSQFAASLAVARTGLSATTLLDGHVLVAGGNDGHNDVAMAEIYDPELGFFWETESMNTPRSRHVAMRLPGSNTVLVAGGMSNGVALKSAEQYAHWGQLWLAYEPLMSVARVGAIAAPTSRPGVVVIGGGGNPSGEYYGYATVTTDKDDYHPLQPVTISGSGWQPGEVVNLRVSEDADSHYDWELQAIADEAGNITNHEFYPREDETFHHVGMRFYLSAVGIASQAQTTFTDAESYQASFDKASLTITAIAGPGLNTNKCYRFQFFNPSNLLIETSASGSGSLQTVTKTLALTAPFETGTWRVRPQVANGGCDKSFTDESLLLSVAVTAAPSTTTVAVSNATFDGIPHGGTAIVTGPGGLNQSLTVNYVGTNGTTYGPSSIAPTNAGNYTVSATFPGNSNYSSSSDSKNFSIAKAASTTVVTITGGPFTYTGAAITPATVAVTGTGNLNLTPAPDYAQNVNAGTATASYTFAGDANHTGSTDSKTFVIGKAASTTVVTITGGPFTFTGAAITPATVAVTGVGNLNLTPTATYAANVNAGTATASYTFAGDANHMGSTDSKTFVINKADATISVTGYTGAYDGNEHGATGSATGVGGVTLSGLDLGAKFTNVPGGTVHWTFAGGTNYKDQSGDVTVVINKADATVTVTGYTGTYDGLAHGATGSATGVGGVTLSGLDLGAKFTNVPGGTAHWAFTDVTGNYKDASGDAAIVINKANASVTVDGYTGVYDGNAHGATGSAKGVNGEDLTGLNLGQAFTDVPGGTASWTFTDTTDNYNNVSGTAAIVISKADAVVTVNDYTGVYDGNAHGATGSATGVGAVALSGLDLGAKFTNVPGGTAHWTFSGGTNYKDQSGDVAIVINKADATVTVTGYTGAYDGNEHGATGSATGVGGVTLSGLDLGAKFTNVPGGTVHWTFAGGTNYKDQSGDVAIVINKADATVTVTGYTGTYDGLAHGATGSATGVGGVTLSGLDLGAKFTNVPGGTVHWTFAGGTNYKDQSGDVTVVINKADATVTVTGYTGTYDGLAHGATGSATGVGGVTLSGLDLGAKFTNVPGGTAHWAFADATGNYKDASGDAAIVINKANASVTVDGYSGVYDGNAHGATGTAKGVKNELLTGLDLGGSFTNVPGGTADWTFTDATGNYNNASGTATIVLTKADAAVTVSGYTGVYDGGAHGATGTAKGVDGSFLGGLDLGETFTNVPGGTAYWAFTDATGNYKNASGTAAIVLTKADATITVTGYNGVYDGAAHGATGAAAGIGGVVLSGLDLGQKFTNAPGGTATWTFTDTTGNYNNASGTAAIAVTKAEATIAVTGYTGVYDGAAHGAMGTATGVQGEPLVATLSLGASFINTPGGTAHWTFAGNANYNAKSGSVEIIINKADAVIKVDGSTIIYDGNPHGATGMATGVNGEDLGSLLNLGASFTHAPGGTVNWSFAGDGNYNTKIGSVEIVINKADAVVKIDGITVTYDGNPHGASGTATGVKGEDLGSLLNLGASFTHAPGGTADWSFTGDVNYKTKSGSVEIVINKADAIVKVDGSTVTYDGNPHGASGTATGVKGEDLASLLTLGPSFTNAPGGSANWNFAGNGNYNNAHGTAAIVISKADAMLDVTGYTGVYDGAAHGATGSATGVKGEVLAGLVLGDSFTNVPGGTASWTFTDATGNYNNASGTAAIVITKADATISVTGYTGVYDGAAHGATGTATGVKGEDLAGLLTLGEQFTNVPGGTAQWSFAGGTNYKDQSGSVAIVISKADAAVSVTGYTGVYDGVAHGATGTATGVKGEDLAGLLTLGEQFTNVPGGTAHWTFSGGINYKDRSGDVGVVINKAKASVAVTDTTVTYDGQPHGATGSATGVNQEVLAGLVLGESFTDVPGGTAHWTFKNANYADQSGDVAITINKADAAVTVSGYAGNYDGNAHGATGKAKGATDEALAGLVLGASFTNVPGGTAHWTFTDVTGNYNDASGDVAIDITRADATVTVAGYKGVYDAAAHGATGSARGVDGNPLSGLTLGATFTNVPGGTAHWAFTDVTGNYNNTSGDVAIDIMKADAKVNVTGYAGVYNAAAHGATGSAKGIGGNPLSGLTLGATFTNVPGGTAHWTFTDATGNYNNASGDVAIAITKADATVTVTGYTGVYDAAAHGATGSAKGVGGNALAGLDLGDKFTGVPGGTAHWRFIDPTGNYNNTSGDVSIVIGAWSVKGFYQPVGETSSIVLGPGAAQPTVSSATVWNSIKGGQTVPMKFNIYRGVGGAQVTTVADAFSGAGFSAFQLPNCSGGYTDDEIPLSDLSTGGTDLRWDGTQFIQNWKTPKVSGADLCYRAVITAKDGSTITAFFKVKK